ncbi:hypothetical protein BC830DRAFT_1061459 [Chytriomyces sp. MP71]|nr:hypothetical protein BC830DRAFT_1061459 [Chytriomyces sp. MP71]
MEALETDFLSVNKRDCAAVERVVTRLECVLASHSATLANPSLDAPPPSLVARFSKTAAQWLTSIVIAWHKRPPVVSGIGSSDLAFRTEQILDRVSVLNASLARLSGQSHGSAGGERLVKNWVFTQDLCVQIRELSFEEAAFGWQTWVAGVIFAYFLSSGKIPITADQPILELGCGTGIVGIVAAKLGAKQVIMTDYQLATLENAVWNAKTNKCQSMATIHALDWTWIAKNAPIEVDPACHIRILPHLIQPKATFDVVFGADICYELIHGELVPPVCARFLSTSPGARIYLVTGLRGERFANDVIFFEKQMALFGFKLVVCEEVTLDTLLETESDPIAQRLLEAAFSTLVKQFRFHVYERDGDIK